MDDLHITTIKNQKGSKKQAIMLYLKKHGRANLETLSKELNMSKMGVLKHINPLEELGYLERENQKADKGRPKVFFKLSDSTRENVFPNNYSNLTNYFLNHIEKNYGETAVIKALKDRNNEVNENYKSKIQGDSLEEKIGSLRLLRDQEGYMAELHNLSSDSFELLEFNCPIFKIAEQYSITCQIEQEMFENLLDANVESKHRVVNGDNVCRFLIQKRK